MKNNNFGFFEVFYSKHFFHGGQSTLCDSTNYQSHGIFIRSDIYDNYDDLCGYVAVRFMDRLDRAESSVLEEFLITTSYSSLLE